jgi:hypothetical protein
MYKPEAAARRRAIRELELLVPLFPVLEEVMSLSAV